MADDISSKGYRVRAVVRERLLWAFLGLTQLDGFQDDQRGQRDHLLDHPYGHLQGLAVRLRQQRAFPSIFKKTTFACA